MGTAEFEIMQGSTGDFHSGNGVNADKNLIGLKLAMAWQRYDEPSSETDFFGWCLELKPTKCRGVFRKIESK